MSDSVDLNAYFQRLGYQGERRPTLATLAELQHRHVRRLPFENLTPFLGEEVVLDIGALERKLVGDRRGGYCYEHNLLFLDVLKQLGFQARGLAARVFWKEHPDARPPATHMLLAVDIDGDRRLSRVEVVECLKAQLPIDGAQLDVGAPRTTRARQPSRQRPSVEKVAGAKVCGAQRARAQTRRGEPLCEPIQLL